MCKKHFITGITGFVGLHLTEYLLEQNCEISGIYYPENQFLEIFKKKFNNYYIKECNLLEKSKLFDIINEIRPNVIYHLAAISSVKYSFKNIDTTIDINLKGFTNLLESVVKIKNYSPKIIFISSADVYGESDELLTESHSVNPISPYAITKYSAELFFKYFCKIKNIRGLIVRPFNHIGPYQRNDFSIPDFAKQIAEIEQKKKSFVISVGNLTAKRDFTDVRDIVRAYYMLSSNEKIFQKPFIETFNIGSGNCYAIENILQKLIKLSILKNKIHIEIDKTKFRPNDIKKMASDNSKIFSFTGWKPEFSLNETLKNVLNYWRKQIDIKCSYETKK